MFTLRKTFVAGAVGVANLGLLLLAAAPLAVPPVDRLKGRAHPILYVKLLMIYFGKYG